MVYLHKPSNCFILSNIFLRHKQQWKKSSILLKFNMLGGIPRVYVGVPPIFIFYKCISKRGRAFTFRSHF